MGDSSQSNSHVFSIRIVSMDYYMSSPIPGLDISYSSFQGGKVNQVPVIRIYGSTAAGQKTCMHIHNVFPYLYIPYGDLFLQPDQEDGGCMRSISLAVEKALKLKGNAGSKRQHVHSCSLVRAKKFYGYHSPEELFVKIYLYHPQDVSRASKLLLEGAVLDKVLQPHESHIPYLLQFLVDYNLYGMGYIHVSKIKFRHPVPEVFSKRKAAYDDQREADLGGDSGSVSPIWMSSTIPNDWIWQSWSQPVSSTNKDLYLIKRQSTSELEGDAIVEDILNQMLISYTPLSQTCSDVKMVQSLIPIWEEELERSGTQGPVAFHDPGKPLPEDGLKMLSDWPDLEKILAYLTDITEVLTSPESIKFSADKGNSAEHFDFEYGNKDVLGCILLNDKVGLPSLVNSTSKNNDDENDGKEQDSDVQQLSVHQLQISSSTETKASDQDAMGLLKWLASSHAVEDINSDDELTCETILSPLLPATTMKKVLEKANMDFENLSQQECQDILDSVEDTIDNERSYMRNSNSDDNKFSCDTSLNKTIPQVDGSTDDVNSITLVGKPYSELNHEFGTSSRVHLLHSSLSVISDRKRKVKSWGTLPVSSSQNMNSVSTMFTVMDRSDGEQKLSIHNLLKDDVDKDGNYTEVANAFVGCSMRDLMRKKRCYRAEVPECWGSQGKQEIDRSLHSEVTDEEISRRRAPEDDNKNMRGVKFPEGSEMEYINTYSSLNGDRHVGSLSDRSLLANMSKVEKLSSSNRLDFIADHGENKVLQNDGIRFSSLLGECETPSCSFPLENYKSAVSFGHANLKSETFLGKDFPKLSAVSSSSKSSSSVQSDTFGRDSSVTESPCRSRIFVQEMPEISDEEPQGTRESTGISLVRPDTKTDRHHQTKNQFHGLMSMSMSVKVKPSELVGMTFFQKPPVIEWTDNVGSNSAVTIKGPLHKGKTVGVSCQNLMVDDLCPFFLSDHREERNIESFSCKRESCRNNQEAAMGVPVHYQNDGSHLYMLTPVSSPPSVESIRSWLSNDGNSLSKSVSVPPALAASPKNLCNDIVDSQGSPTQSCSSSLLETIRRPVLFCNLDRSDLQNHENTTKIGEPNHDGVIAVKRNDAKSLKCKASIGSSQEMSQISGPDVQSKLTPLSQIGFRDPASVGCGQQLTMVSIEVQAESRGDLRPDPRFDAINIISLVFQEDNDSTANVFILLRCNIDMPKQNIDGVSDCQVVGFPDEEHLFGYFAKIVCSFDPDVLMGWDVQVGSLGFLAQRAAHLGIGLLNNISRTPSQSSITSRDFSSSGKDRPNDMASNAVTADSVPLEDTIIEDEWGRTHASGVHVSGRIVLNIWRLMRNEVKLNMYTIESVADAVLRKKVPSIPSKVLTKWFSSGPGCARYRCMDYVLERAKLNLQIMNQLDMINRTSELARVFGIDFFSVLSRGSQFRVESMFLRLAHTQNYVAISPGSHQVAYQPAMECLPLVMEPESGFYTDPVLVLDFQSLYPSMIIAYNLCFCTCLGKIIPSKEKTLGVSSYLPDVKILQKLKHEMLFTPNNVMYVPSKVRRGVLPRLLEEILSTRIMVKQAMKKLGPSQRVLHRILDARQLALKLIANVTYGYTAAGFSGRMPCAELADSIVQCGRRTLETSISFVNNHAKWKAKVIYGDTDSMFVLLKGRSRREAFQIGNEIAATISAMNPNPVTLKMEKVYHPCFLLAKKRYVGYSYESPDQSEPKFDAKGIETVRRDTCGAVAKTMEQSLRIFFETQDVDKVKVYLLRQWRRIISGKISLQDFVFAKEVRLGTYSARPSSLPPAAIVATKAMKSDPRAEPRYAERIPYVVVHGEPGARLCDMVVDPLDLLALDSPFRLNDVYYIRKQIIPALQRVFGLVGADLNQWYSDLPRPEREAATKRHLFASNSYRTRIDFYYLSKRCILCGSMVQGSSRLCQSCSMCEAAVAMALTGRTAKLEKDIQHLAAICRHCGGADWLVESGVKCTSLACPVFYERRKIQKELKSLSAVATEYGFYPKCMVEWF